jgi:GAF domain-containing protein
MPAAQPPSSPIGNPVGDFARIVQRAGGHEERLQRGVELVVELVDGCDHAGVTVASAQKVSTAAASDDLVRRGDAWQYELREGPCLDTVRQQHTVICQNLTSDGRWSNWSPRVVDLGIHAMMSLLLYTEQDNFGALNLYSEQINPWDHDRVAVAHALAGYLATAVADAREIEGRTRAMTSRTVIGQAQGILMERYNLDADRAFDYLRRMSQHSNRKLITVASELATTRRLPEPRKTD